jgi:hypothetical protein
MSLAARRSPDRRRRSRRRARGGVAALCAGWLALALALAAVGAGGAVAATASAAGAGAVATPVASTPTTTYVPSGGATAGATTAPPATATTPAATTPGATATTPAATTPGATPTTPATTPTTGSPAASAPGGTIARLTLTQSGKARANKAKGDRPLSAGAIVIAALALLLLLGCIAWALARRRAFEPHWLLSLRHAMAEAGFRASATWSEFTDWARLGR